jgi:hypothetical protein
MASDHGYQEAAISIRYEVLCGVAERVNSLRRSVVPKSADRQPYRIMTRHAHAKLPSAVQHEVRAMIDISTERLVPISDVPRKLPPRSSGKRVHISAVYRWIQRGVRGVHLEVLKIGGTAYTSVEALQRFADQLSQARQGASIQTVTPAQRQRQIERAKRRVAAVLGRKSLPSRLQRFLAE